MVFASFEDFEPNLICFLYSDGLGPASQMAESLALDGAFDALDMVLDAGAENLYQKYLTSKVKAHSARTCRAIMETIYSCIQIKRDDEPGGA